MEQYTVLQDQWITNGKGFVLMYSIIDKESFKEVKTLRKKIEQIKGTKTIPMILVGNKSDMGTDRVVTKEEGQALSEEFKCPFFETSAKNGINCTEAFHGIIKVISKKKEPEKPKVEKRPKSKKFLMCF